MEELQNNTIDNKDISRTNVHEEIPLNSDSLLIDQHTARFSSAIWYEAIQDKKIILAGLGGIGSYVAFLLSRINPAMLFMYDPDKVEEVNMAGQLYNSYDINNYKVNAISKMINKYSNYYNMFSINEKYDRSKSSSDIMICGFDNMESRKIFFHSWITHVKKKETKEKKEDCLFIDGRLNAEEFQVFCIRGDDEFNIIRYNSEFLFSDKEADNTICSYKQTSFMATMIASVIVNLFVNFVANQCNPLIDRDLPFFTNYNAETMYFKTEA